jgi:hypothetical protein
MADLDATGRARVLAQLMRDLPAALRPWPAVTKTDLAAAVAATDDWIDDNAATYNSALPQPARGALSSAQKTFLFCYVALRRAGLLKTEEGD